MTMALPLRCRDWLNSFHLVLAALALGCLISTSGCGKSSSSSVHGKVTLDGENVTEGNIVFLSQGTSGPKAAAAIAEGVYSLSPQDKLLPGTYRVEISWRKPTGRKIPAADPGVTVDETRESVPAKYNTESTLTAEIGSGDVEKNFDLTSK